MKNTFFILFFLVISPIVFGQEIAKNQVASVKSLKTYSEEKFKDTFTFDLSEKVSKQAVDALSKPYTNYFKVELDERKNSIKVVMNDQDWKNRKIMRRLFVALSINEVQIDGKSLSTTDFFQQYVLTTDTQTN